MEDVLNKNLQETEAERGPRRSRRKIGGVAAGKLEMKNLSKRKK